MTTHGYVVRCDRCGISKVVPAGERIDATFRVIEAARGDRAPVYSQLCPSCFASFVEWMGEALAEEVGS
ncbi:MAG: hypothetical protein ACRDOE_00510 [Streptosporangiaceae bacterium]